MLKVKQVKRDTEPVRHIENIRGEDIPLYIRPWTAELATELKKDFTRGFEWDTDPAGKKVKKPIVDEAALLDAQIDYIIAGWDPAIGDDDGTPWPADLAHKKALLTLTDDPGRPPIFERILNASTALAFEISEEQKADLGNS